MECLGVPAFRFQELQQKVVEQLEGARTSIQGFIEVLRLHDLGRSFGLAPMLGDLITMLTDNTNESIKNPASFGPFIQSLISYAIVHANRALKYQARIPVPRSWNLVGVADEGYRYWKAGMKNMRTLREREIFGKTVLSLHTGADCMTES
jgi:RNA-dependent RNA polymerase